LRWFFVAIGAIITNLVGIWIVITALTPVTGLPDEAIDAYAQGVGLAHRGDYQDAVSAFNEALDADASYANAYYGRGNAHYDMGLYEQAGADYQAALEAGKDDIGTTWNLGWTHYVLGNFEQAIETTQNALALRPDQPALYFNLGLMQLASGELEAAQETYQTGKEIIDQRVSGLRAQGNEPPSSLWWYMDTAALDLSRLTNCLEEQVCQEAPPYEALSALDDPQATAEQAQELRTHLKNLTVAMEYNEELTDTPVVAQVGSFEFAEGVRDETGNVVAYAPLPVQGTDLRFGRIFEGESELVNPTTVRPSVEGTQDLFLIFDYEEMQDQQPVVVKIYLDGKEVSGLRLVEEWSLGAEGEAVLPISPGSQFSLPPGNYWVELYVDNQLVQQGGFTITGP
jgi:tetratricopeptide (TPR) repeat protein